ncbi:LON peptidase substrate-binding domain-containing protein [Aquisphaera insulae]|uniref:LON peptidase substrate-binding domain-containing protein n=1 Tax=Aquisphaera insulae TaxID=2712864 RepID=UPI0013ECDF3C|nr:LON peptidase substrate-binding domain-containing protein [Aquisphaera insulae]
MILPGFDPRDFSGLTRLFPLAGVVIFPHSVIPLHIFEPRYRQMTEDALSGDRLITIIQTRSSSAAPRREGPVPLEGTGCLGQILQHVRLSDGRFNMLLLGLRRVTIRAEVESKALYRLAEVDILEDEEAHAHDDALREELIALFRQYHETRSELGDELAELLQKPIPLGALTDIIAHSLPLTPLIKQGLLEEPFVGRRSDVLRSALRKLVGDVRPGRTFPPPFSVN